MKRLTLLLSDLVVFYGTLALVLMLRYEPAQWADQYQLHAIPFSILFGVWLFALYIANLYEPRILRNGRDFFERLAQAIAIAAVLSLAFFYLIPYFGIAPKTNLFLFILLFAVLETAVRSLFNRLIAGGSKKRLLIVGVNADSLALARYIGDNPQFGYAISGLVRLGQEMLPLEDLSRWRIIEDLDGIEWFIRAKHIDTVVISPQAYEMEKVIGIFYRTLAEQVDFSTLANFTERLTGKVPLGSINQSWFLENVAGSSKKSFEVFKRGMDIVIALVLGIPTLVVMPFVAVAIALTSPGPVFFRQTRTGRAGRPFEIIKFRTMRQDAEKTTGAVWAQENDPRVTRIGRFLRKTRIDELPQVWNILVGDMSFVGPRAERPEMDGQLAGRISFYKERYLIKPGLSGWAQINYPYGASVEDSSEKLQYDLYYIKHRSLTMDLEIILKTINISLRRAGR